MVYETKNEFRNAIKDYNRAIQIEPDYADAYNNRGSVYAQKGDLDSAIKDFTDAIYFKPDDATSYINRGNVYIDKGKLELAIKDYTKAIKLKPDDANKSTITAALLTPKKMSLKKPSVTITLR